MLYVSSSTGDDSFDGLTPATAVKTIGHANKLMGPSIQAVLLKSGDSFTDSALYVAHGGSDPLHPFLISSYGSGPRPIVSNGLSSAVESIGSLSHVALAGLEIVGPYAFDAGAPSGYGIYFTALAYDDLLFEDLLVHGFRNDVAVQTAGTDAGVVTHLRFRRNEILDSWDLLENSGLADRPQGLYGANVIQGDIEENIFDNNGNGPNTQSEQSHSVYWQTGNFNATFQGNFVSDAPDSVQLRGGGLANDNLFFYNGIALTMMCLGENNTLVPTTDCEGEVLNNVILDGHDLGVLDGGKDEQYTNNRTWGIQVGNNDLGTPDAGRAFSSPNTVNMASNIVAHAKDPGMLDPSVAYGGYSGVALDVQQPTLKTTLQNNVVVDWGIGIELNLYGSITLNNNEIQLITPTATNWVEQLVVTYTTTAINGSQNLVYSPNAKAFENVTLDPASPSDETLSSWLTQFPNSGMVVEQIDYASAGLNFTADLGDYYNAIMGTQLSQAAGAQAFILRARQQSKANWDPRFTAQAANAWFRTQYGVTAAPVP